MTLLTCVLAAQVLLAPPPPTPAPTPAGPAPLSAPAPNVPPITQALPFARFIASDLAALSDDALLDVAEHLRTRLFSEDGATVIEVVSDLELALRFATAIQLLESRPSIQSSARAPAIRAAARSAAYLLHATGWAYETRVDVRASLEAVLPPPNAPNRGAMETLIASVQAMRGYGNAWFPAALAAVQQDQRDAPTSLVQEGYWLSHEGKPADAAERLTRSLAQAPDPRVALQAYDTLLSIGSAEADGVAAELRQRFVAARPILDNAFESLKTWTDAARATGAYEAQPKGSADLPTSIAQAFRYIRVGRAAEAEALAREVLGRFPNAAEAWHAAAEVYYQLGRYESLRVLFLDAEAGGHFDARLREIRIAARMSLRVHESLGEMHHPLADGDLEADLAAFIAANGGPKSAADLAARTARIFIAIAGWMGAKTTPQAPVALAAAQHEIEALLAARPKDPDALRVALVAFAGLEQPLVGVQRVTPLAAKLPAADALALSFLLARVEAGVALRERDVAGAAAAVAHFAAIDKLLSKVAGKPKAGKPPAPAPIDRATYTLAATIARLGEKVVAGAAPSLAELDAARGALEGLEGAFDESDDGGRLLAQARGLAAGTLAELAGDPRVGDVFHATAALKRDELGLLASGIVQFVAGDAAGAGELFERASAEASRPAVQQWLAFARYKTATFVGDAAGAKSALGAALDQWDAARLPAAGPAGPFRPIFMGDFNIGLKVEPGVPLALELRASPVLTLLPELATTKAEAQAILSQLH